MDKKILSQLETLTRWLQAKYMSRRRTKEIVEPGRILFHPQDVSQQILLKYQERLKRLGLKLK